MFIHTSKVTQFLGLSAEVWTNNLVIKMQYILRYTMPSLMNCTIPKGKHRWMRHKGQNDLVDSKHWIPYLWIMRVELHGLCKLLQTPLPASLVTQYNGKSYVLQDICFPLLTEFKFHKHLLRTCHVSDY